jgi:hypothetical protein
MADKSKLVQEQVTAAIRVFRDKQETPTQLAGPVDQARTNIHTGDPSLDDMTRDVLGQLTTLLRKYSECLDMEACALEMALSEYQAAEEASAEEFEMIRDDAARRPLPPPPSVTGVPVAGRDYGSQLNPPT